jgi:hypothetical protein
MRPSFNGYIFRTPISRRLQTSLSASVCCVVRGRAFRVAAVNQKPFETFNELETTGQKLPAVGHLLVLGLQFGSGCFFGRLLTRSRAFERVTYVRREPLQHWQSPKLPTPVLALYHPLGSIAHEKPRHLRRGSLPRLRVGQHRRA